MQFLTLFIALNSTQKQKLIENSGCSLFHNYESTLLCVKYDSS